MPNRGYYFDFIEFAKNAEKNNTPSTPAISLIFGLQHILGEIDAEGIETRFARHAANNAMIHAWGARHGFRNFAPEGNQSVSLTCFHTPDGFDQSAFIKTLKSKHGFVINGGYGKIKGTHLPHLQHGQRNRGHHAGAHRRDGRRARLNRNADTLIKENSHPGCFGVRASSLDVAGKTATAGKMPAFRDRLEAYPPLSRGTPGSLVSTARKRAARVFGIHAHIGPLHRQTSARGHALRRSGAESGAGAGQPVQEDPALLVDQKAPLELVIRFVLNVLPLSLMYTLPWGFLSAVLLVFGRLSSGHEITGFRVAGISLVRLSAPVFVIGALLSLASLWININVVPTSKASSVQLIYEQAARDPDSLLKPGVVQGNFKGDGGGIQKVLIEDRSGEWVEGFHYHQLSE